MLFLAFQLFYSAVLCCPFVIVNFSSLEANTLTGGGEGRGLISGSFVLSVCWTLISILPIVFLLYFGLVLVEHRSGKGSVNEMSTLVDVLLRAELIQAH